MHEKAECSRRHGHEDTENNSYVTRHEARGKRQAGRAQLPGPCCTQDRGAILRPLSGRKKWPQKCELRQLGFTLLGPFLRPENGPQNAAASLARRKRADALTSESSCKPAPHKMPTPPGQFLAEASMYSLRRWRKATPRSHRTRHKTAAERHAHFAESTQMLPLRPMCSAPTLCGKTRLLPRMVCGRKACAPSVSATKASSVKAERCRPRRASRTAS